MKNLNHILLVGGTHGNELTGVRLIEHWSTTIAKTLNTYDLLVSPLIANPSAVDSRVRFVEEDLNRQFTFDNLHSETHIPTIELDRAKQLYKQFGDGAEEQPDLVIDVHNTTSNMGATLILVENSPMTQQLARYVSLKSPTCNILLEDEKTMAEHPYLCTIGKHGIMLEMGAQPQGVCRASLFKDTLQLLQVVFDFCHQWNCQSLPEMQECDVYRFIENIEFPLDQNGNVAAMIASSLQDNDFCELAPGDAMFECFNGEVIPWNGRQPVYPHFINEAAYQRLHVAFATAVKIRY